MVETDGMMEWYERALRGRSSIELEDARVKFWTNIDTTINDS